MDWERWQSGKWPWVIVSLVSLLACANAWTNVLVYDDAAFAVSDRFASLGFSDLVRFFTEDLWAATGTPAGLYRPMLLLSFTLDVLLFDDWIVGYHLVNIVLHTAASVLVYGFLRYLLSECGGQSRDWSGLFALLAALVFAVHPVHVEAVNSIFNQSDILVAIGSVGGIWWFLRARESNPAIAWAGLALVYLLILLSKESAVTMPGIAAVMLWMTTEGNWKKRVKTCLPVFSLLVPLAIYFILRANALIAPAAGLEETTTTVASRSASWPI